MTQHWLLKTEPSDYSFSDLEKDGQTAWDGVTNNLALRHLRSMRKGDLAFIYHTGKEKSVVGIAAVTSAPYPDPERDNPKLVVVDVRAKQRLARPVTLGETKAEPAFSDFLLVRLPRLSIMPVSREHWDLVLALATDSS